LRKKVMVALENINPDNVLGDVCRSFREGQTGEDVHPDIFELILPATVAQVRYLQYLLVSAISPDGEHPPLRYQEENRFDISLY